LDADDGRKISGVGDALNGDELAPVNVCQRRISANQVNGLGLVLEHQSIAAGGIGQGNAVQMHGQTLAGLFRRKAAHLDGVGQHAGRPCWRDGGKPNQPAEGGLPDLPMEVLEHEWRRDSMERFLPSATGAANFYTFV
jgi:hypothetical protein